MQCLACGSTIMVELHHTIPRSMGGENSELVPLCKECHNIVHRISHKLIHYKWDAANTEFETFLASKKVNKDVLVRLINKIVSHAQTFNKHEALDDKVEIRLKLPRIMREAVKAGAKDLGVNVEKFIIMAMYEKLKKMGYKVGRPTGGPPKLL